MNKKDRNSKEVIFSLEENKADSKTLQGHAIVYDQLSAINKDSQGYWATKIEPFAFTESLQKEIFAYLEHDNNKLLASTSNESLIIKESAFGVFVQLRLNETTLGNDTYTMVQDGLLRNCSFGVTVTDAEWSKEEHNGKEIDVRTIKAGEVFEVTLTHRPAFPTTDIAAFCSDKQDREKFIEEVERQKEEEDKKLKEAEDAKIKAEEEAKANQLSLFKAKVRLKELETSR